MNEDYHHLLPREVNSVRYGTAFKLSNTPEVDELISDEFGGENGVIEVCKVVVRNYTLVLAFTDIGDSAEFVRLIRD